MKYLGVLINQNLSWKYHIDSIITKISENVGLLAKLRHSVPRPIQLDIYKSLIHRLLYFADLHDHAIPLFLEANVLPITFLYHESVSSLMCDINNDKAPANMFNFF